MKVAKSMAIEMISTEIDRQREYLADLPKDYNFPLFSGRQAVESQRRSGYRDSARAAREIVDNAYEAGAKNLWITFDRVVPSGRKKHERANTVSAVAFIDDGPGMLHESAQNSMVRYALSWGGGTHFKDPKLIGKFGFGLPNSSINQTKRVEVYSKTADRRRWVRGVLDINEVPTHGLVEISEPSEAELPDFVADFLKRKNIQLTSGTIVVWDKPDRLTWTQASTLAEKLRFDFRVTYRGILDDFNLFVESDERLQTLDPLFLSPDALYYLPPEQNGAFCSFDKDIVVKYFRDKQTGRQHLVWLKDHKELESAETELQNPPEDEDDIRIGTIAIRVARFPYGFVNGKVKGTDAYARFEYRKDRRGMSFVRCGREIETVDVFPKHSRDEASGLGSWPLLQAYAYHWAVECRFCAELDEAFGIGNDKQTVRPIEDFWRVLAEAHVDKALVEEQRYQHDIRKKEKATEVEDASANSPALDAATQARKLSGRPQKVTEETEKVVKDRLEKTSTERAKEKGTSVDEARAAIERESERARYGIGFVNIPGGVFMQPDFGTGLQVVAQVNRQHPFYAFYSEISGKGGIRLRNAVNLILLGLAEAELYAASQESKLVLSDMREHTLNRFLSNSLKILDSLVPSGREDEDQHD